MAREEPVDPAITEGQSLGIDLSAKFSGGDVRCRLDKRHNQILVRLDTPRTPVAAQGAVARLALFARQLPPAAHARGTHTKTRARPALVGFPPNGIENWGAWIKKALSTCPPACCSGKQCESDSPPFDPIRFDDALKAVQK